MALTSPTNENSYARHFLKHIFLKVPDSRHPVPRPEYEALATQLGLSDRQLAAAIKVLKHRNRVGIDPATQSIVLTPDGVHEGDYLQYREPSVDLNDPLPETLTETRAEIRHVFGERQGEQPGSYDWEWKSARLEALRHQENVMVKEAGTVNYYIQSGTGGRFNVHSTDNSVNHVAIAETDIFPKLRSKIQAEVPESAEKESVLISLSELERAKGSSAYGRSFRTSSPRREMRDREMRDREMRDREMRDRRNNPRNRFRWDNPGANPVDRSWLRENRRIYDKEANANPLGAPAQCFETQGR
jgi:hypothetical protein